MLVLPFAGAMCLNTWTVALVASTRLQVDAFLKSKDSDMEIKDKKNDEAISEDFAEEKTADSNMQGKAACSCLSFDFGSVSRLGVLTTAIRCSTKP